MLSIWLATFGHYFLDLRFNEGVLQRTALALLCQGICTFGFRLCRDRLKQLRFWRYVS